MSLQRILARGRSFDEKDSSQDYKKEDITVKFYRRLARPVVARLEPYTFITPNRLSWFGFTFVLLGAGLLIVAENNIFLLCIVGFSYWFAAYIDTLDGMLARLRKTSSKNGEWLDSVLEEGKGYIFFLALGLHIQDAAGQFTLTFGSWEFGPLNIWFMIFLMYGAERWLALMAVWGNFILDEPRVVSFGNVYVFWAILILYPIFLPTLNIFSWTIVIYTIGSIFAASWTLFEKTILFSPQKASDKS
ncbi:MAG: CDP-alcohol phosphatidyltransferase family protein [Candidatus Hodarchaeales archaeon]|jgi:phosphatidylglycerophosphate synthase